MPQGRIDIDSARIAQLKHLMGGEYPGLVAAFLAHTENYIAAITAALAKGDRSAASFIAHKMKASCGQFGLLELQDLAWSIERSENRDDAALQKLCDRLKPVFRHACAFLQQKPPYTRP